MQLPVKIYMNGLKESESTVIEKNRWQPGKEVVLFQLRINHDTYAGWKLSSTTYFQISMVSLNFSLFRDGFFVQPIIKAGAKLSDMKHILTLLVLVTSLSVFGQGGILNRVKQKVKDKAEQRAEAKIDEGIEKGLDETEKGIEGKNGKTKSNQEEAEENQKKEGTAAPKSDFQSYSRYDFVPGENILYAEDFSQDVVGEFPLKWSTNNRGEAVTIKGFPNKWMRMFIGQFVSPEIKKLPENFTVEFDMLLTFTNPEEQSFGSTFPKFEMQLLQLSPGEESGRLYTQTANEISKVGMIIQPAYEDRTGIYVQSYHDRSMYFEGGNKELKKFSENYRKSFHVAMWVQKQRLRLWINGDKIYDIPQAISPQAVFNHIGFWTADNSDEENVGVYVSNIKVAQGTPDIRSKLITEGKLVTHGILFDIASDKIKPESAGVLKEIAAVLKENPDTKVKIIGHTDSDGDDVKNMDLSKRRAAAVKLALTKNFQLEEGRLQTDGLGESKPVSGNTTKEGKALNRRVEFIKL
jgi:outer membrane protein OmpA-like peptidoglycan-associated protein